MKKHLLAAALALGGSAMAQDANVERYRALAFMSGVLDRAAKVCTSDYDTKAMLTSAAQLRASIEQKAPISPDQITKWGEDGAGDFSGDVTRFGIPSACSHATEMIAKAREAIAR
jgi:hypothetical protein